jgi:hypothetical protein
MSQKPAAPADDGPFLVEPGGARQGERAQMALPSGDDDGLDVFAACDVGCGA